MPLAYFYCVFQDPDTQKARNIFGSWIVQLAKSEPTVLESLAELTMLPPNLSLELIQNAIISFAERNGPILLVLDAMDQSQESSEIACGIVRLVMQSRKIQCLISTAVSAMAVFAEHGGSCLQVDLTT